MTTKPSTATRVLALENAVIDILDRLEYIALSIAVPAAKRPGQPPKYENGLGKKLLSVREVEQLAKPLPAHRGPGKTTEDLSMEITEAMMTSRLKLPARMFIGGKYKTAIVNGHTFKSFGSDGGRSGKIHPSIFGAEVGDTLVISHDNGNKWVANVVRGNRKQHVRNAKPPVDDPKVVKEKAKTAAKLKAKRAAKKAANPTTVVSLTGKDTKPAKDFKALIAKYGEIALENANTPGFEQNQNILSTGAFDLDARVYLTSSQSSAFRREYRKMGIKLAKVVEALNAYVYE